LEQDSYDRIEDKIFSGAISRNGVFRCENNFILFYNTIVEKGIETFFKRKERLSNRARVKETNYKSKPIIIEKNLSHSANSVIHENPYVHATITDYLDSSNYDVWVLSNNRITVVPQTVCSMSSLNRLCGHISREFQEGRIKELEESIY